jgi:hypothetical protein
MKRKTARKTSRPAAQAAPAVEYDFSRGVTGKYAARYWKSVAEAKLKRPRKKPA